MDKIDEADMTRYFLKPNIDIKMKRVVVDFTKVIDLFLNRTLPYDGYCSHEKTTMSSKQVRSADEIETIFIHCLQCDKLVKK